jgi:hypothetical protein
MNKRPLLCRQLPTLPHTCACSTIGPVGLNFRVRDGNGCDPHGIITDFVSRLLIHPINRLPLLSAADAKSFEPGLTPRILADLNAWLKPCSSTTGLKP